MRDSRLSQTVWPAFPYPSKKKEKKKKGKNTDFLPAQFVELNWSDCSCQLPGWLTRTKDEQLNLSGALVQGWSLCTWKHKVGIFSTTQEVIFSVKLLTARFSGEINNISCHRRKPTRDSFVSMLSMEEDFNDRKHIKWEQGTKDTRKKERKKGELWEEWKKKRKEGWQKKQLQEEGKKEEEGRTNRK